MSSNNKNFNPKYIIIIAIALIVVISLIFLIKYLMSEPEEPEDEPPTETIPIPADNLQFRGFQLAGDQVTKPWCKGTEYAYKYIAEDGMESEMSPFLSVPPTFTESNPMLQVTLVPDINIQMYRKVGGSVAIPIETTFDKDGVFIDINNPCEQDFKIPAPQKRMESYGGTYTEKTGTLGSYDKIAQKGESPWCKGTSYVYKYTKDGRKSDQSPVSIVVKSFLYYEPVFKVELNSKYGIEILRSVDNNVTFSAVKNQIIDADGYFVDTDNTCTMINPSENAPKFLGYTYKD
jgi:hypothetical protein